nr:hypothetical protein [Tanacetum cinerariifolium]
PSCSCVDEILVDGASWLIKVDTGESAISTALGIAATLTRETTISGGWKYSSNIESLLMANLSEDTKRTSFDTRLPMLDSFDFESWQQCIRLYCVGKENRENILQSIDEGSFKMGKFRETLTGGALGPERDRVVKNLTPKEKERTSLRSSIKHNLLTSSCDLLPSCHLVTSGPTCSYCS